MQPKRKSGPGKVSGTASAGRRVGSDAHTSQVRFSDDRPRQKNVSRARRVVSACFRGFAWHFLGCEHVHRVWTVCCFTAVCGKMAFHPLWTWHRPLRRPVCSLPLLCLCTPFYRLFLRVFDAHTHACVSAALFCAPFTQSIPLEFFGCVCVCVCPHCVVALCCVCVSQRGSPPNHV